MKSKLNNDDYLHGYCHQWVLDNYKNGDKIFIITDYDYDINSEALVHCGIYRHNKYVDVRGEFNNIDDILNEFDYGEEMKVNIIDYNEFKDYCKENSLLNECDVVSPNGGLTFGDVEGMGDIYFPGERGDKGSGDLPKPSGTVYKQIMPFDSFIKKPKNKKKKGHFKKEDEECVHPDNPPVYKYVDDYRTYAERIKPHLCK